MFLVFSCKAHWHPVVEVEMRKDSHANAHSASSSFKTVRALRFCVAHFEWVIWRPDVIDVFHHVGPDVHHCSLDKVHSFDTTKSDFHFPQHANIWHFSQDTTHLTWKTWKKLCHVPFFLWVVLSDRCVPPSVSLIQWPLPFGSTSLLYTPLPLPKQQTSHRCCAFFFVFCGWPKR